MEEKCREKLKKSINNNNEYNSNYKKYQNFTKKNETG